MERRNNHLLWAWESLVKGTGVVKTPDDKWFWTCICGSRSYGEYSWREKANRLYDMHKKSCPKHATPPPPVEAEKPATPAPSSDENRRQITLTDEQVDLNRAARGRLDLPIRASDGGTWKPVAYHLEGCHLHKKLSGWQWSLGFATPEDAQSAGHWPCKVCSWRYKTGKI